jgi:hypothetical protein
MMLEGVWKTETKKEGRNAKLCSRGIYPQSRLSWAQLVSGGRTHQTPKGIRICGAVGATNKNKTNPKGKKKENR